MNEIQKAIPSQENNPYSIMENVVADGDLSKLTPKQRVEYYHKTCESLGLNPLTRPFEYQRFNGKVVLYARKEASEQLRFLHKVSIYKMEKEIFDGVIVITSYARTPDGKEDISTGAVPITGLKGEALSNAYMKAETKSKRRVTLSICGLGFTDETEISSIPNSQLINVNHETGEIIEEKFIQRPVPLKIEDKKSNEQTMKEINVPRTELINAVGSAKSLDDLKIQYARAYTCHAGRLDIMKDITELKDLRKQQIEEFNLAMKNGTFDEDVPLMPEKAELFKDISQ